MDRRDFLVQSGAVTVAGFLPANLVFGRASAAEGNGAKRPSTEQRLAGFATALKYESLPKEVVASAKMVLVDSLACAFGAVGSEPANIAENTIRSTFGNDTVATIIGYPRAASIEGAVFVNGVLVRSLDLNDTYIGTDPLHPSEIFPTALALCEHGGKSGRDLIEAIAVGYEASSRINDAISFMERGFHPLCAASYAIPLIAGKLWNLPQDRIANAVGLSAARGYTSFVVNSGAISMMRRWDSPRPRSTACSPRDSPRRASPALRARWSGWPPR